MCAGDVACISRFDWKLQNVGISPAPFGGSSQEMGGQEVGTSTQESCRPPEVLGTVQSGGTELMVVGREGGKVPAASYQAVQTVLGGWHQVFRRPCVVTVFQSLNRVQLFATPGTAEHQASPSFTTSRSLFKLISFESMM